MIKQKLSYYDEFEDLAYEKRGQEEKRGLSFSSRIFSFWFGTDSFIVDLIWKVIYFLVFLKKTNKVTPFHYFGLRNLKSMRQRVFVHPNLMALMKQH